MKRQHLLALVVLALVLAVAGIVYQVGRSRAWDTTGADRRVLPNLAVNDVATIIVKTNDRTLTVKNDQGTWRVAERNGYPADFQKIRDLLRSLWELKAGQTSQIGPAQHARLHIVQPGNGPDAGTEINLLSASGQALGSLLLGKTMEQGERPGPSARFVYNPQRPEQVYLVAETFSSLDPLMIGAWLDKTFFSADGLKEVAQTGLTDSWKLTRADTKSDWKLDDAGPTDTLNKDFSASLVNFNPSFTDVRAASPSTLTDTGLQQPILVNLKTFDGFDYRLALGKEGPDKTRFLQVKVSAEFPEQRSGEPNEKSEEKKKKDEAFQKHLTELKQRLEREQKLEPWIYLVSDWSLEPFLKRRDEIIAHPSPSPAVSPALPR